MIAVAVVAAGIVGAVARYLVSRAFAGRPVAADAPAYRHIPLAVLAVNVVGSAIGGAVLGLAVRAEVSSDVRLILLTGLCGGLTTFSTFSVETIQLAVDGKWRAAALSLTANLVLGVGAAALAFSVMR